VLKRRLLVAAAAAVLSGCYELQPAATGVTPTIGSEIALDVNDAGRVALGGLMGPEIAQIEGRLLQKDSSEYFVGVTLVHLLRGGEQVWSGEKIHVKSEFVSSVYEKKFSRGRSIALGSVGLAGVVVLVTRSLLGSGAPDVPVTPDTTAHTQRRPRR
jgi:hypothetical protein